MANYKPVEEGQGYFLQINPSDHFSENSIEKVINNFVEDHIDFSKFSLKYKNDFVGQKAIHPRVKLKVIFYSWVKGIKSSRQVEDLMSNNHLGYVYLSGNRSLDHTTICEFINEFVDEIEEIFSKLLLLMNELGMVDWSKIMIDGTRVSSNASKDLTSNFEGFQEKFAHYKELSKKLVERWKLVNKLEGEGKLSHEEQVAEQEKIRRQKKLYNNIISKIKSYEAEVKNGLDPEEKVNLTDRDSRLLKDDEAFKQGYNVQVAYSNNDVILDIEAVSNGADQDLLEDRVMRVEEIKAVNNVREKSKYMHDKGYFNPVQLKHLIRGGLDLYVACPDRFNNSLIFSQEHKCWRRGEEVFFECKGGIRKKGHYYKEKDEYRFELRRNVCCRCNYYRECWKGIKEKSKRKRFSVSSTYLDNKGMWFKYKQKMESEEGKMIYNKRIGKEHNFQDLKRDEGLSRLLRRGKRKCNVEVVISAIAHNLKKMQKMLVNDKDYELKLCPG